MARRLGRTAELLNELGFDVDQVALSPRLEGFYVLGLHPDRVWSGWLRPGVAHSFVRWPEDRREDAWAALRWDAVTRFGASSREVELLDLAMSPLKPSTEEGTD